MRIKNIIIEFLAKLIIAVLLSFSLSYALLTSLFGTANPYTVFAVDLFLLLLFTVLFINKKSIIITSIVFALSAATFAILVFVLNFQNLMIRITNYFTWIYLRIMDNHAEILPSYKYLTIILLSFIVSMFVYWCVLKKLLLLPTLAVGLSIFIFQWVNDIFLSYSSFYLFIVLVLIIYFRYIYLQNTSRFPGNYVNAQAFTLWGLPVCLIIFVLALSFPSSSNPLEFKWLDSRINDIINYFDISTGNVAKFDYFSYEQAVFNKDFSGSLGGEIKADGTEVLEVDSLTRVYLRGAVRDFYTGNSWLTEDTSKHDARSRNNLAGTFSQGSGNVIDMEKDDLSNLETGMSMLSGEQNILDNFFIGYSMSITYKNLITKSVFIPAMSMKISSEKLLPFDLLKDNYDAYSSRRILKKKFNYTIEFYKPKYDFESFKNVLRKSKKGVCFEYLNELKKSTGFVLVAPDASTDKTSAHVYELNFENNLFTRKESTVVSDLDEAVRIWSSQGLKVLGANFNMNIVPQTIPISNTFIYSYPVPDSLGSSNRIDMNAEQLTSRINQLKAISIDSDYVYQKYLQLPSSVPSRVHNLASSIASSFRNNYDKVRAIEQYFSRNYYLYTLRPKLKPEEQDFVDHFLFGSKEGYCTYYASAMAVMVRSIGLPARYVEGYMLPSQPREGTKYIVTNEQAHAWVEVYFEGYGWLAFEPTSSFNTSFYDTRMVSNSENNNEKDYDLIRENSSGSVDLNLDLNELPQKKNPVKVSFLVFLTLVLLVAGFISLIIFNTLRSSITFLRYANMVPRDSIIVLYGLYVRLLSLLKFDFKPGETPLQFAERVNPKLFKEEHNNLISVTNIFIIARYSNLKLGKYDRDIVVDFHRILTGTLKSDLGIFSYFIYKFILGRI